MQQLVNLFTILWWRQREYRVAGTIQIPKASCVGNPARSLVSSLVQRSELWFPLAVVLQGLWKLLQQSQMTHKWYGDLSFAACALFLAQMSWKRCVIRSSLSYLNLQLSNKVVSWLNCGLSIPSFIQGMFRAYLPFKVLLVHKYITINSQPVTLELILWNRCFWVTLLDQLEWHALLY